MRQNHQDYTVRQGIGIRLAEEGCRVIRKLKGRWTEIGPLYKIPVEPRLLTWTPPAIPPGVLALALEAYEHDHPGTRLRYLLTMDAEQRRRLVITRSLGDRQAVREPLQGRERAMAKAAGV